MIDAVIFDMDGLLIDSEPIWREAEKEIFSQVDIQLTDQMCFETVGLRIEEVVDHWHERFPWTTIPKTQIAEEVMAKVEELIRKKGKALPGVQETIDMITAKNIPMAIASGSHHRVINTVVEKLELKDKVRLICSAEDEEHGKPHPGVFLSAASKLKARPTHCLVFEDSFNGVIAGRAARMKVVAVPEDIHFGEGHFQAAHLIYRSLLDLNWEEVEELFRK